MMWQGQHCRCTPAVTCRARLLVGLQRRPRLVKARPHCRISAVGAGSAGSGAGSRSGTALLLLPLLLSPPTPLPPPALRLPATLPMVARAGG